MNETEFWKIIDLVDQTAMERESRAAITYVVDELSNQSMAEIKSFYNHLCSALFKLDTRPHFMATEAQTDDSFEYQRCYVVGKGRQYYLDVLKNPSKMPKEYKSFEWLLSAAPNAWANATGLDDFPYDCSKDSPASGSNDRGWGFKPGHLRSISIADTRESIAAMLEADRTHRASLFGERAKIFVSGLKKFNAKLGKECVVIELAPSLAHGRIAYKPAKSNHKFAVFDGGFDAANYIRSSSVEQQQFFIDLAAAAAFWLCEQNKIDSSIVERAKRLAESQIS